jgi:serine/threonine protein kinase
MTIDTVAELIDLLGRLRLLSADQFQELTRSLQPRFQSPRDLAKELLRRGWLTVYQVNQLFQRQEQDLVLGPYRILDLIGEGGVSRVYKVWHEGRNRPVALKVIRREMLSNNEVLGRFQREMLAVARLSHPNIVQALDVKLDGVDHYFAMELVEGTDLGKLVQLSGPLRPRLACEYICQAALGLQHVHEHGLVHRDIKPQNLLLTRDGVVKLLDLGLARLRSPGSMPRNLDNLTQEGIVIGTPDYLAPEQARNPSGVDIRADIYGLGCSFFYLLAGQPPFPGGSLMQKLFRHQKEKPRSGELLRPEVQQALGMTLEKMMAKEADDRYQTPAEVAAALAPICRPAAGGAERNPS